MSLQKPRLLVVDDEEHILDTLRFLLEERYRVLTASTGQAALEIASQSPPHVALLDIMLPDISGLEVLERLRSLDPTISVIMVTALNDVKPAVEAMKTGALDYIVKPFEEDDLLFAVEKAFENATLSREVISLREEVADLTDHQRMIGTSRAMTDLQSQINRVADQNVSVLVTGESGTGKELIARAIHYRGVRRRGPFVAVNCSLLGSDLTESELFGHEKGAFTGAATMRRGKFELADRGTLFLDEIGTMPGFVQAKLLRILEDHRLTRLGGEKDIEVDIRVIAATNADLRQESDQGRFRRDLFFRLNVIHIQAPPLRERLDDIPLLVEHFLRKHRRRIQSPVRAFSPRTIDLLKRHDWPGNVRELENAVLTLLCMADKEIIEPADLDSPVLRLSLQFFVDDGQDRSGARDMLLQALEIENWNLSAAARRLGVHRNTVRNQMTRFGIEKPQD